MAMYRETEETTRVDLKTRASRTLSGCLEAKVVGTTAWLGTASLIKEKVCFQGKITVVYWSLYPVGEKKEPWIITPEVMSLTGYFRQLLLFKENFHLWDFLEYMWQKTNEDQLGDMWRDVVDYLPARILKLDL